MQADPMQNSSVSLLTALITAVIVFLLGGAWARMRGASKAYKTIKAGVKPARHIFWGNVGKVLKIAVGAAALLLVLVVWQVRDFKDDDANTPVIPAQVTPTPTRK
jgi:O-antigen ligase